MKRYFVWTVIMVLLTTLLVGCEEESRDNLEDVAIIADQSIKDSPVENDVSDDIRTPETNGSFADGNETETKTDSTSNINIDGEISEGDKTEQIGPITDEIVYEFIVNNFDLEEYEAQVVKYRNRDYRMDKIVDVASVCGRELKIAMSYDDVLSNGFSPEDEGFGEIETGGLAYTNTFIDPNGENERLGFIGEKGSTVKKGVLYSIHGEEKKGSTMTISGIRLGSDLQDVIDELGKPTSLGEMKESGGYLLNMGYECNSRSLYINVYVDPKTGKVAELTLEGYGER